MTTQDIIIQESCKHFGYESDYIIGKTRNGKASRVRFFIYFMLKKGVKKITQKSIGKLFSNRDHSSVHYGLSQVNDFNELYPKVKVKFDADYRTVFRKVVNKLIN